MDGDTLHILEVGDSLLQFLQTPPPDGQRVHICSQVMLSVDIPHAHGLDCLRQSCLSK